MNINVYLHKNYYSTPVTHKPEPVDSNALLRSLARIARNKRKPEVVRLRAFDFQKRLDVAIDTPDPDAYIALKNEIALFVRNN